MKKYSLIVILLISLSAFGQQIKGRVTDWSNKKENPIPGVNVTWINTTNVTTTDVNGEFVVDTTGIHDRRLVFSFVGYSNDTILINDDTYLTIRLIPSITLKTAEVVSGTITAIHPIRTEIITNKELRKAACCNLGESFETNATVDVTYKDAITGSKEIQVLGLSGAYTQLLTENVSLLEGLGLTYGLNGIPGTQIDAINIVKGTGSVIFGPESISSMVNVDLKDPEKAERIFVNGFIDENMRKELNVDKGIELNEHLHTLLSFHIDHFNNKVDDNKDTFLDMPLVTNTSLLNKWKYTNHKGLISQNSVKYLYEQRMGGQKQFDFTNNNADLAAWGQKLRTNRIEFYGRTGYIIPSADYNSIGVQYAYVNHTQNGFYGLRDYNGVQDLLNVRIIYNRDFNTKHIINVGTSMKLNRINEHFDTLSLNRRDVVPGFFLEDTYSPLNVLTIIAGIRTDYVQNKLYWTPRMNIKYALAEHTNLRLTGGYGLRTSNILAENPALLVSSKEIIVSEQLNPERAYTIGVNFDHQLMINYRKGGIAFDLYRTTFKNKIISDLDRDPLRVYFYNFKNNAYSNNLQFEVFYKIFKTIELKLAYKYLDVYRVQNELKIRDPYIAKHRVLGNLYFESFNQKWKANFTTQWVGSKRLPKLHHHSSVDKYNGNSPTYFIFNTQITRIFKRIEWYAGIENIFDFKQNEHIIGSEDPYGPYFDASYIWGPMDGRKVYAGFRFKISNH